MMNLGINTLVYLNDLSAGVQQSQLLRSIAQEGVSLAQVRREYITSRDEMTAIRDVARELKLSLYYSVPEPVVVGDSLHPDFEKFLEEAEYMGIVDAKFNQGNLPEASADVIEKMDILARQHGVTVSIENDQTSENGTRACTRQSLRAVKENGGKAGYTFDLGNWFWQNEDPVQAFDEFKQDITIFHLKNVLGTSAEQNLRTVRLDEGKIAWKELLAQLDASVPVFIEYPIENAQDITSEVAAVRAAMRKDK